VCVGDLAFDLKDSFVMISGFDGQLSSSTEVALSSPRRLSLNQVGAGDIPGSKLAKWSSIELYELIVSHNDHIPTTIAVKKDRSRALILFRQYDVMITPDEKKLLK
jgi:hypothetical protein